MKKKQSVNPVDLLLKCTQDLTESGSEPWDYGWCVPEYRRSQRRALSGPFGPLTMSDAGVEFLEAAIEQIWRDPAVRHRWDEEELWSVVTSLIVHAAEAGERCAESLRRNLEWMSGAPESLVVALVSNVKWDGNAVHIANAVVGHLDSEFMSAINAAAKTRQRFDGALANQWVSDELAAFGASSDSSRIPLAFACWVPGQHGLAIEQARWYFENLVSISLLLERNPSSRGLYSLRGTTNRPGIRGLRIDRSALERICGDQETSIAELSSRPIVLNERGSYTPHQWHGAEPVPIREMLLEPGMVEDVAVTLSGNSPVSRRLQIAARWFAEAHWSSDNDDAALALGVALDALVGSRSGLPGRAMSERFALLEPDRRLRRNRAERYNQLFSVRSAVAHGGESSELRRGNFVREMAADVTWAAYRLLDLQRSFPAATDAALESTFTDLKWGTLNWSEDQS